jgi:putative ABC transport system substrate-binding protein
MQFDLLKRREFIAVLGGAAAWPVAARAQQSMMPVVGFLNPASPDAFPHRLRAFRQGLKETGYVEGENVAILYAWAEGQYERLPALAAELVRRQVAVIAATGGPPSALAAKTATPTIPIVFSVGEDPVRLGLVASFARPGGNATGINILITEVVAKRMELLHELLPRAARFAVLINPASPETTSSLRAVEAAARTIGVQVQFVNASTHREIDAAFATLVHDRPDALFVAPDPFFASRRVQIATLAARHVIPATYSIRDFVETGGLMSYGTNFRMRIVGSAFIPVVFSKAPSPPTFRSSNRPGSSLSSTCPPPGRSASTCRRRSSRAPTR